MANYPEGILLSNKSVILELVDETAINSFTNSEISYGYIRQLGASAFCGTIDDRVQYKTTGTYTFQQSEVTYVYVPDYEENILFRQNSIA